MLQAILAGAGALAGVAKSAIERDRANRMRKLQAETTRYSPWTGMKGEAPVEADWIGNILQGGLSGASLGQNIASMGSQNRLAESQADLNEARINAYRNLDSQADYNPWTMMPRNKYSLGLDYDLSGYGY